MVNLPGMPLTLSTDLLSHRPEGTTRVTDLDLTTLPFGSPK